ncbi:MAG TPA: hypothetical protein VH541_08165 [Gaiellaceae bacterium]|jgi:hypothetical protein
MRGRIPLFVLLASSLTFLASLFLPWRETQAPQTGGIQGLLNQFSGNGREIDGWVTGVGDVAVLLIVAVVVATIAALRRPHLAAKLPFRSLAIALGYFAVAVAVEAHTFSKVLVGGFTGHPPRLQASWAYGFYLGTASAGIVLLSGLASRRSELLRPRGTAGAAAGVLGITLLTSFLLPWFAFVGPEGYSIPGIVSAPVAIAALGLILGAGWLHSEGGQRWRLPFAIATAILTGGAASGLVVGGSYRYGTWIGIGCAVSLVALEAVRAWPLRLPALPRGPAAVRLGAAALLIVALFLPWQELDGSSYRLVGWYEVSGAAAGTLCLLLLATPALPVLEAYLLDTAVAVALFVSALGTSLRADGPFFRMDYGAIVGFVAAGILLGIALLRLRPGRVDKSRALARAVPLALSVLCVAAVVIPIWFVLPERWRSQSEPLNSWLAVSGVLLGLYLIRLWALRVHGPASTRGLLTLVPLVLLTLPSLELIRFRDDPKIQWGAVILVGLCLLLAVFGWIEEHRGLEGLKVPEAWRVDRLPGAES